MAMVLPVEVAEVTVMAGSMARHLLLQAAQSADSRTWSSETVAAAAPLPVPVFRAAAVFRVDAFAAAVKAAVAPATPPKPPEAAEVQKVLDLALADLREQAEPAEGGEKALRFATAVQLCAASGDGAKALDLLDQMKDALEPDLATYLAGLSACEVSRQPLERVWFLLDDMRKQGLDLDAPLDLGDGDQALLQCPAGLVYHEANLGVWEALQHHARTWLVTAPPQKALHAAARLGGLLRSHGSEDEVTLGAALREYLVKPVVQALQHGLEPQSPLAVVLHAAPNLGAFTVEVLVALGLATSDSGASPWQLAAAEELRRQAMLRQWANWHEPGGPGLLAWMAYDLNGGDSKASWEMCSDGECYGRAPIDSKSESDELLPPLARDASSTGHAERRALLALTEQILLRFPADSSECLRVEGVILIYTPQSPATASIYAMRQFLQLFPWVVLRVAFGPESGRAVWELPERRVEVIGESRPPNTSASGRSGDGWASNYPLHSLKGGGKADGKGKGKDGKGKPVATNGTNGSNGRG
ncbi:unnamed protein product [Polarella glacialis]|uniref:Uncharacterized protein n=1 Tax=Polarella glacialis TaxID=89957 RepID=A0A813FZ60_POLGL|nr:unnamed protein product [Polarella glacialis]